MSISIQPPKADEIPAVVGFIKEARAAMFPMLDAESHDKHAKAELEKFQNTYLDHPYGGFLTARSNDQLIATIGYLAYDDRFPELNLGRKGVVEMVRLYVHPDWRRNGLASDLVARLEQMAREAGIERIYLHTQAFLEGAVAFWERQGFSILQDDDPTFWQTTHMIKPISR